MNTVAQCLFRTLMPADRGRPRLEIALVVQSASHSVKAAMMCAALQNAIMRALQIHSVGLCGLVRTGPTCGLAVLVPK